MARVSRGVTAHARHKKILKLAKGYRGRSNSSFRVAIERVEKALQYAYRDRRVRKRNFRGLWIQRINAGAREHGLTYSQFMNSMKKAGIEIDRKVLSDLAIREPEAFAELAKEAQSAIDKAALSKAA
ncbi:MAG: 50S ribosomal protein L20 [Rhodospirillaceae bacterium]|nr:50S ribosomal protein L20 [Rhodospirillaceae bacterium]